MNQTKNTYSVNLPKTAFPMKGNLPRREPEILSLWRTLSIYHLLEEHNKKNTPFILHDGPPYANGHIHLGHVVNKVLKDFVVKYKMMTGHFAPFVPGWDCHGLPIEHQLMKERHLNKHAVSLIDFRNDAAHYAQKFIDIQREEFIRLGAFADWDHPYRTMDPRYEKKIVESFHRLLVKGYIYRKKKPVQWCASCETALADAEVEYEDLESPSIYVAFPVIREGKAKGIAAIAKTADVQLVIWTTTPWTLPANVAIALKPGRSYVMLTREGSDARYLIELSRWEKEQEFFTKKLRFQKDNNALKPITAEELSGIECRHPFMEDRRSRVILADFVDIETGTGAVHIAPGHGEEDYLAGLKYSLPILSPVDHAGKFTDEVPQFKGQHVFSANDAVIQLLKNRAALLYASAAAHAYPHCWRCKNPIIFRATEQWFLSVEHQELRQHMLEAIRTVEWIPSYGEGRIAGMIETRPDWCLSRQRYWGTPITVLYCDGCGVPLIDQKVMQIIEERIGKEGTNIWFTAPDEEFLYDGLCCSHCGGTSFHKEKDILDVWFDSGVSYEAVLRQDERLAWPADLYLEGSDQHRGWFQTSLIPAVALNGKAPFRAVLTHGFTVDGEGKKMSKSLGNVIAPEAIIRDYGADILRLWVAASDYRDDIRISSEIIKLLVDVYRRIRNTLRFLLGNTGDFSPSRDRIPFEHMLEIDRWALHRLQKLIEEVHAGYDMYEFHRVWKALNLFCAVDMSAIYFDVLKDRLYTWQKTGTERRSAQTALYDILHGLVQLVAPLLSFTAEETWQIMKSEHPDAGLKESVFLGGFPRVDTAFVSDTIDKNWERLLTLRDKVNTVLEEKRQQGDIHSSLEARVDLECFQREDYAFLSGYQHLLDMLFIVSAVHVEQRDAGEGTVSITVQRAGGKKCQRCWRWQDDITGDAELCGRCRSVVGNA